MSKEIRISVVLNKDLSINHLDFVQSNNKPQFADNDINVVLKNLKNFLNGGY